MLYLVLPIGLLYYSVLLSALKGKQINKNIVNKQKNIQRIIREFTRLYREISHYDSNYWSKFLFVMYSTVSSLIATEVFFSLVIKENQTQS